MAIVVLSAGRDAHVLESRNKALSESGFIVVTASGLEAINKLFGGDFDAVLLCHSLHDDERRRLAGIVKSYSPSTPVIVLSDRDGREFDYGTLTSGCYPHQIIAAIRATVVRAAMAR